MSTNGRGVGAIAKSTAVQPFLGDANLSEAPIRPNGYAIPPGTHWPHPGYLAGPPSDGSMERPHKPDPDPPPGSLHDFIDVTDLSSLLR